MEPAMIAAGKADYVPLCLSPLVVYVPPWSIVQQGPPLTPAPLSLALKHRSLTWVRCMTWFCDHSHHIKSVLAECDMFRSELPLHRMVWCANTYREYIALGEAGVDRIFAPHNMFISPKAFYPQSPLDGREFDAVYNAAFADYKRHHLLSEVERLLLLGYNFDAAADRVRALRQTLKSPHFANEDYEQPYRNRLLRPQVNDCYSRAACGLAVSSVEGAMFSSAEYLLAGLPVVTTLNRGGRDHFLDGRFALHVADDPKEIAKAVQTFKAQQIPPQFIRDETIRKLRECRGDFALQVAKAFGINPGTVLDNIDAVWEAGGHFIHEPVADIVAKLA